MKTIMARFIVLLVALSLLISPNCFVSAQRYPPSGVFSYVGEGILTTLSKDVSASISSKVNSYKSTPADHGSGNGVSYTFSTFVYDVFLGTMSWRTGSAPSSIEVIWTPFIFSITFNYNICSNDWPNPCEDGWVKIFTTNNNVNLNSVIVVDYSGAKVFLNDTFVALAFKRGDVEITVQCTDVICLINPQDIANSIAANFVSTFQKVVEKAVNDVFKDKLGDIDMIRPIPFKNGELALDLEGDWFVVPAGVPTPPIIFTSSGAIVIDKKGDIIYPPFEPSSLPNSILQNATDDMSIYFTPYVMDCALWSMGTLGDLSFELTSGEVPADSPVQLNSNDPFFTSVVPGLSKYPNMNITVDVVYLDTLPAYIDVEGIHPGANFTFSFSLISKTQSIPRAWVLGAGFIFDLQLKASLQSQSLDISFAVQNETSSVTQISSQVGPVITEGFVELFQLLVQATSPVVKGISIVFPDTIVPKSFDVEYGRGFVGLGVKVDE